MRMFRMLPYTHNTLTYSSWHDEFGLAFQLADGFSGNRWHCQCFGLRLFNSKIYVRLWEVQGRSRRA